MRAWKPFTIYLFHRSGYVSSAQKNKSFIKSIITITIEYLIRTQGTFISSWLWVSTQPELWSFWYYCFSLKFSCYNLMVSATINYGYYPCFVEGWSWRIISITLLIMKFVSVFVCMHIVFELKLPLRFGLLRAAGCSILKHWWQGVDRSTWKGWCGQVLIWILYLIECDTLIRGPVASERCMEQVEASKS